MRQRMNGRGLHPRLRDSSFRFWTFDDESNPQVQELIGNLLMTEDGTNPPPEVIPAPFGTRARAVSRATDNSNGLTTADASGDSPTMQGEWTVGCWLRLYSYDTSGPSSFPDHIWALAGNRNLNTQVQNKQASLTIDNVGQFGIQHESGAGVDRTATFTNMTAELGRWYYVVITKTDVGGGQSNYSIIVNGQLIQVSASLDDPDGGTDPLVRWQVGPLRGNTESLGEGAQVDIASLHVWSEVLPIDVIKEDFRRGYLLDQFTHVDLKVEIEDANGLRRDATDLDNVDFVEQVTINEGVDQATNTCQIILSREQMDLALAHLRTDTKLNLTDVDVVTSYDPLVEVQREVEVFAARMPLGIRAGTNDWQSRFRGLIDDIDWGGEDVKVNARDDGGELIDVYVEEEVLNPAIIEADRPEKQASYGATAGDALQNVIQDILDDNDNDTGNNTVSGLVARTGSYDPVTLQVEGTPNWLLLPYRQRREPVMTAIRNLAGQIGWECRYRFNQGDLPEDDDWELTLYEPERDRVDSDILLTEREVEQVQQLAINKKNIRNVVRIVYPSSETALPVPGAFGYTVRFGWSSVDGAGNRLPAFVELEHTASVARFGRRFMEIGEANSSQIDTIGEAERMAFAAAEDLKEPDLEKSAVTDCLFEIEINDIVRFEVVKELYTVIQTLAVVGLVHTFGASATTTLQLRGKPAVGFKRWLQLESRPGMGRPGVADPRLALTDSESGPLLRVLRELMDQSDFNTGGKYLAIKNQDFQFFSAGLQNPPDAWLMTAGVWGTDALDDSGVTRTGGHSIELPNGTGTLTSDWIPIESDADQTGAYSFEMQWQRASAGATVPSLTVQWADVNRAVISTFNLTPGGAVTAGPMVPGANPPHENFPTVPTTSGVWFNSRADGIQPPTNARFVRLTIVNNNIPASTIYVDKVAGYRTSRAALVYPDGTTYGAGGAIGAGATSENIPFLSRLNTTVSPNLVGFDRGINIVDGKAFPSPATGCHWVAKEPGTIEYEADVWVTDLLAVAGSKTWRIELVRNGTYDGGGVRTGGTVIATDEETATWTVVPPRALKIAGGVQVVEGDRLSVDLNFVAGPGGSSLAVSVGFASGVRQEPTRFSLKHRGLD